MVDFSNSDWNFQEPEILLQLIPKPELAIEQIKKPWLRQRLRELLAEQHPLAWLKAAGLACRYRLTQQEGREYLRCLTSRGSQEADKQFHPENIWFRQLPGFLDESVWEMLDSLLIDQLEARLAEFCLWQILCPETSLENLQQQFTAIALIRDDLESILVILQKRPGKLSDSLRESLEELDKLAEMGTFLVKQQLEGSELDPQLIESAERELVGPNWWII